MRPNSGSRSERQRAGKCSIIPFHFFFHTVGELFDLLRFLDHIHMACLRCGKIMEFESNLFDRLKGQIQRDCRFHIVVTRLEVGGYCAQCRSSSPA